MNSMSTFGNEGLGSEVLEPMPVNVGLISLISRFPIFHQWNSLFPSLRSLLFTTIPPICSTPLSRHFRCFRRSHNSVSHQREGLSHFRGLVPIFQSPPFYLMIWTPISFQTSTTIACFRVSPTENEWRCNIRRITMPHSTHPLPF